MFNSLRFFMHPFCDYSIIVTMKFFSILVAHKGLNFNKNYSISNCTIFSNLFQNYWVLDFAHLPVF
jgi:hypothetical protein